MAPLNSILLYGTIILFIYGCNDRSNNPKPTEVLETMEDGNHGEARQKWLTDIHGGPQSNWQQTEYENNLVRLADQQFGNSPNRDGEETFANGAVAGKWLERGSNNQAGSVMNVYYQRETDELFAIGAGGPLFKGGLSGFTWELVNDDYRFDHALLEMVTLPDLTTRLVSGIAGSPHYSDDGGKLWTKASGIAAPSGGSDMHTGLVADGIIYLLAKKGGNNNYILYSSEDGKTYKNRKVFDTSDGRNLALCKASDGKAIYLIEQRDADKSHLYTIRNRETALELKTQFSNLGFGADGRANIQCAIKGADTTLYSFNGDLLLHVSKDQGLSWQNISKLPSRPWNVGLFVPPSNERRMLYGEVNAVKSLNGGSNWSLVNNWDEYYANVQNKLHADIMVMREFVDQNGKNVVIIGHHGGISLTYDYGLTTKNITLAGLNVSQYYDARSYPPDPDWIFAGSQDQGMQRGYSIDENIADFHQQISGDYGHISFTSKGRHMWIMYPGGSLSFYLNPLNQNPPNTGYQIVAGKESVWIPPIAVDPHTEEDVVYVAGGSSDANKTGAYVIEVRYNGSNLEAKDLPFDFSISGGRISAIAISPLDADIWFVATDNGYIYRSVNGGLDFTLMQKMTSNAHYLYGSCILPSATDPNVVYLSGSGYGTIAPVYVSKNGGTTFTEMRSGMPSTVAFNLALNETETRIYAATEAGPYVYLTEDQRWHSLSGEKTPNQTYWSVEYVPSLKTARFATYGRGVWDFKESEETTATNTVEAENEIVLWPMPCESFLNWKSEAKIDQITIFDIRGNQIINLNAPGPMLSLEGLPGGLYTVRMDAGTHVISRKIFKL